jgi:Trypsin-co-occurring domain 1
MSLDTGPTVGPGAHTCRERARVCSGGGRVGQEVLVCAGGTEFYAEVARAAGPQPVSLDEALSFDGVRDTIKAVCGQLAEAWEQVKPDEATVEFGLRLVVKTGKLTGLLVDGGGEASLKVTLTWRSDESGE